MKSSQLFFHDFPANVGYSVSVTGNPLCKERGRWESKAACMAERYLQQGDFAIDHWRSSGSYPGHRRFESCWHKDVSCLYCHDVGKMLTANNGSNSLWLKEERRALDAEWMR